MHYSAKSVQFFGRSVNPAGSLLLHHVYCEPVYMQGTNFVIGIISNASLTVFLFMAVALAKVYGPLTNKSGIYTTVAAIFLFQAAYSVGWTPLLYLPPPEVLNYPIRDNAWVYLPSQRCCSAVCILLSIFSRQHWMEDIHDEWFLGCSGSGFLLMLG